MSTPNTVGTYTITVTNVGTGNTCLAAASFNMNTLAANTVTALSLTTNEADLTFAPMTRWLVTLTSNNVGFDGAGVHFDLQFQITGTTGEEGDSDAPQTFVYRPGGVPDGNVYTNFTLLYADMSIAQGKKELVIDATFNPTPTIPDGTYDFIDVAVTDGGLLNDTQNPDAYARKTTVTFGSAVTIRHAYHWKNLHILGPAAGTSPLWFDEGTTETMVLVNTFVTRQGGGGPPPIRVTGAGTGLFVYMDGGPAGGGFNNASGPVVYVDAGAAFGLQAQGIQSISSNTISSDATALTMGFSATSDASTSLLPADQPSWLGTALPAAGATLISRASRVRAIGPFSNSSGTDVEQVLLDLDAAIGGASGTITVKEEGVVVNTNFTILNFVGGSVTATDAGAGEATITITGGGSGGGLVTYHEDVPPTPNASVQYRGWAPVACELQYVRVYMQSVNTQGNYTLTLLNEATAATCLAAANFDMNTLAAATVTSLSLTGVGADLAFAAQDRWTLTLISDDPAFDGSGIYFELVFAHGTAGLSGQDLATTLVYGSVTGGNDITLSVGDQIVGEGSLGTAGNAVLRGGTATGGVAAGGDVILRVGAGSGGSDDGNIVFRNANGTSSIPLSVEGDRRYLVDTNTGYATWSGTTNNATPTELFLDGVSLQYLVDSNTAIKFTWEVIARSSAGDVGGWKLSSIVKRGVGVATTAIVGTPTLEITGTDPALVTATVDAVEDTATGALFPQVTGVAATTIDWVVVMTSARVVG
jgi:hypothetical protein